MLRSRCPSERFAACFALIAFASAWAPARPSDSSESSSPLGSALPACTRTLSWASERFFTDSLEDDSGRSGNGGAVAVAAGDLHREALVGLERACLGRDVDVPPAELIGDRRGVAVAV